MKGRAAFVLIPMLIVAGCGDRPDRGPVADSTMVDVLIELHLAVARAEATQQVPTNIRDSILTAYHVDSTEYAAAMAFYSEHPEQYAELYSRVLDRLNSERIPLTPSTEPSRELSSPRSGAPLQ